VWMDVLRFGRNACLGQERLVVRPMPETPSTLLATSGTTSGQGGVWGFAWVSIANHPGYIGRAFTIKSHFKYTRDHADPPAGGKIYGLSPIPQTMLNRPGRSTSFAFPFSKLAFDRLKHGSRSVSRHLNAAPRERGAHHEPAHRQGMGRNGLGFPQSHLPNSSRSVWRAPMVTAGLAPA
jgi:hypothetical protein